MAELGLAVVQTLFAALQCSELKEICSKLNYKSQLEDLEKTVTAIKNVLLDADSILELSNEARGYIEDLKDVVYDADDLFDEFLTRIGLKQIRVIGSKRHHEIIEKVRCFFSPNNQASQAYKMCRQVEKIRKKLDAIVDNRKFALNVNTKSISKRRKGSCAYVDVKDIIGRDDEKKDILDKLLDSNHQDVCFLTIVGVGGLGKTALAQLVFNDEKMIEFANLRFWVCVSDQEKQQFDVKAILCKILESVTGQRFVDFDGFTMQIVIEQFRLKLGGKKYLLVLDDVWNENREKWVGLQNLLMLGQRGSRVIVTTRSEMTARIIGDGNIYKLGGLSRENSWNLFEMAAFYKGDHQQKHYSEFVEIGSKIVGKCYNIPLAIKVVGSLLYGREITEWRSFEESGLADIGNGDNEIMSVLKLSYHNLEPSLKSCFTYCAVFPKDFEIKRTMLISLWIAQGYIVPLNGGQSIEDAAEEHFLILLRRCFFQDVKKDKYDDAKSVQIHDLMHDVAQEVGGKEIQVLNSVADHNFGDKIRHVHYISNKCPERSFRKTKIRSYIDENRYKPKSWGIPVGNWICLRVLHLRYLGGDSSLDSIGNLLHLRYLNLSSSFFEALPGSATKIHNLQTLDLSYCINLKELPHDFSKLHNLQTLNLRNSNLRELPHDFSKLHNLQTLILALCKNLKEWPRDFGKLVKLKHLDISVSGVTYMPSGMLGLTSLRVLTDFVVGRRSPTEKQYGDELKDLKSLTNLTGGIKIHVDENYRSIEGLNDMRGSYLSNMEHLKKVFFRITQKNNPEAVWVKLEPHPNLKKLYLRFYSGTTIPLWGKSEWTVSLPHLVKIHIDSCEKLQHMPSFSKLPKLKSLKLLDLYMLEYVENPNNSSNYAEANSTTIFFPSLESLQIEGLKKLKGWWTEEGLVDVDYCFRRRLEFSRLSELEIDMCPNLASFPPCPMVKKLRFRETNKASRILKMIMGKENDIVAKTCSPDDVRAQEITGVGYRASCLTTLCILGDSELENLSEIEEIFESCASSLQSLKIVEFNLLNQLSGGLEHLTALKSLSLIGMDQLNFSEDDDEDNMMQPWKSLHRSLHSLQFTKLNNMTSLPKGMQYLTSLQTLNLEYCVNLKALPESISCLSSLRALTIRSCNALKSLPEAICNLTSLQSLYVAGNRRLRQRYRKPNGMDWPKIQHIPDLQVL